MSTSHGWPGHGHGNHDRGHHDRGGHGHHHGGKLVFGTRGDDMLDGTHRDETFLGFGGDDVIHAGKGNDKAFGGRGDDLILGEKGHDSLFGQAGNDGLSGGDDRDHLRGGHGRDFIVGGAGDDQIDGGHGSDKFVIRAGTGKDTVSDFRDEDRIDLRDFGFASGQDVIDTFNQRGHDAILDLGGGDRLILEHTRVSDLDPGQFIVSDAATGPSSALSPYVLPVDDSVSTVSLLTVGDQVGFKSDGVTPWRMVGIPDGLGAFDNGDGTFTLLMNHELGATDGIVRDHGFAGSFVSTLVIDKTTLEVLDGGDLIQHAFEYDATSDSYVDQTTAFGRFCSADLAQPSAFFNPDSGLGYDDGPLYLNGEEVGPDGRAFAHIASGPEAGTSYELAWLGNMSFENVVANPGTGDKTVVAELDDSGGGEVYFYVGDKQSTGNAIEKAGLTGGSLFGLKIDELDTAADNNTESNATNLGGDFQSTFSLVGLGDVSGLSGADLETASTTAEATSFLRPEDGAWDTIDPSKFYFVTTNAFDAPSRLWMADFVDPTDPSKGGTIKMLLDGTEGQQMLDNMTVNKDGKIILQEDVGNNAHIGKIWEYDPASDQLRQLAQHDPDRFVNGAPNFLTQDEESSGIIDVTGILGSAGQNAYLLDVQAHHTLGGELVQGGQLVVMYQDVI